MEQTEVTDQPLVSCDICMKEIPVSEARSAEAQDYIAHYCGLECYEQWVKQDAEGTEQK